MPNKLGVDDQEKVAVLGYDCRAGEGRVREALADLTAREVLRGLDRHDHTFPATHHVQSLAVEQEAVAARERLATEVYLYDFPALDIKRKRLPVLDCTVRR